MNKMKKRKQNPTFWWVVRNFLGGLGWTHDLSFFKSHGPVEYIDVYGLRVRLLPHPNICGLVFRLMK